MFFSLLRLFSVHADFLYFVVGAEHACMHVLYSLSVMIFNHTITSMLMIIISSVLLILVGLKTTLDCLCVCKTRGR